MYDGIETLARIVLGRVEVQVTFLVVGTLLAVPVYLMARHRGWSRGRMLAGVLAAYAFALLPATTLPRGDISLSQRAPGGHSLHCALAPRLFSGDPEVLLNTLLLVPFGFLAVLCARRISWVLAFAVVAVVAVELVQTITALGTCQVSDLVHNTAGAAVGAGLAALLLRSRARGRLTG